MRVFQLPLCFADSNHSPFLAHRSTPVTTPPISSEDQYSSPSEESLESEGRARLPSQGPRPSDGRSRSPSEGSQPDNRRNRSPLRSPRRPQ